LQGSVVAAGGNDWLYVYSKIAGGSEPASYTGLTVPASGAQTAVIIAYTGTNATTPIDGTVTTSDATVSNVLRFPSVSPSSTPDRWVMFGSPVSQIAAGTTPPTGATERSDDTASVVSGRYIADMALAASGATGTKDATHASGSIEALGVSICIKS
jgi:hypothetical protein